MFCGCPTFPIVGRIPPGFYLHIYKEPAYSAADVAGDRTGADTDRLVQQGAWDRTLSRTAQQEHIISGPNIGMVRHVHHILPSKGIETTRVNITDLENIKKAMKPNTKVIYFEALSNPLLELADIPAIAEYAHAHGCKVIVDNTFVSPFIMRPLDWGADIVIHSATKYYVGHGDAICGVLAGKKADMDRIRYYNDNLGTHISPFDSWLALRGVRTLPLRLKKQSENAMAIAKWLEKRPEVEFVIYPGLESHPQHELAKKLFDGDNFGGMVCFHLKGGYEEMSAFADATKIPPIATSLGDVVTLIYPKKPYNNLIRLSTGIEDVNDLIADFEQAFEAIKK